MLSFLLKGGFLKFKALYSDAQRNLTNFCGIYKYLRVKCALEYWKNIILFFLVSISWLKDKERHTLIEKDGKNQTI